MCLPMYNVFGYLLMISNNNNDIIYIYVLVCVCVLLYSFFILACEGLWMAPVLPSSLVRSQERQEEAFAMAIAELVCTQTGQLRLSQGWCPSECSQIPLESLDTPGKTERPLREWFWLQQPWKDGHFLQTITPPQGATLSTWMNNHKNNLSGENDHLHWSNHER